MKMLTKLNVNYEELLEKQTEVAGNSNSAFNAVVREETKERLKSAINKIKNILGRDSVWYEFNYKSGKVLGILRQIAFEIEKRDELLEALELPESLIQDYLEYAGNPPYLSGGEYVPARPQNSEKLQEVVLLAASLLGVVVEVDDITQEKFLQICSRRQKTIEATLENTANIADAMYEE